MEIIPAMISWRQGGPSGQGDPARETRYGDDPAAMAEQWERRGAPRLHLVDLDGALRGSPSNQAALAAIFRAIRIPAEVGGGLRNLDAVRAVLDLGAAVAVVGTAAIREAGFLEAACATFPNRVALGLDARGIPPSPGGGSGVVTDLARRTS
jgi:phosphoribosylformimino-5-aminoimidazole carboxamide ribotide isomerase